MSEATWAVERASQAADPDIGGGQAATPGYSRPHSTATVAALPAVTVLPRLREQPVSVVRIVTHEQTATRVLGAACGARPTRTLAWLNALLSTDALLVQLLAVRCEVVHGDRRSDVLLVLLDAGGNEKLVRIEGKGKSALTDDQARDEARDADHVVIVALTDVHLASLPDNACGTDHLGASRRSLPRRRPGERAVAPRRRSLRSCTTATGRATCSPQHCAIRPGDVA
jgi:hypothetical protein